MIGVGKDMAQLQTPVISVGASTPAVLTLGNLEEPGMAASLDDVVGPHRKAPNQTKCYVRAHLSPYFVYG